MRPIRLLLLALALALGAPVASVPAQEGAPAGASVTTADPAAPGASALPPRYTPPRTLRAYWHLFVAFAVAWVLLFGYTVAIARRWGRLERELEALQGR